MKEKGAVCNVNDMIGFGLKGHCPCVHGKALATYVKTNMESLKMDIAALSSRSGVSTGKIFGILRGEYCSKRTIEYIQEALCYASLGDPNGDEEEMRWREVHKVLLHLRKFPYVLGWMSGNVLYAISIEFPEDAKHIFEILGFPDKCNHLPGIHRSFLSYQDHVNGVCLDKKLKWREKKAMEITVDPPKVVEQPKVAEKPKVAAKVIELAKATLKRFHWHTDLNYPEDPTKSGWTNPGDKGRHCRVPLEELLVDLSYQRGEVGKTNTLSIAKNFRWEAFGSLVVMERSNGKKYVVDGHQRLLAVKARGDIQQVPCTIFQSQGPSHEAFAFRVLNERRRPVPAITKFRASVRAGMQPQKEIAAWLTSHGLSVAANQKESNSIIDFPATFVDMWLQDKEASKRAILAQREINGLESLHSNSHKGLWWLVHNGVKIEDFTDKIKRMGGKAEVSRSINALAIEMGRTANTMICGRAILRVVNHGKRRKIVIKTDQ